MRTIRLILVWCIFLLPGGLVVLSAVGAFLGAEAAGEMFNSLPLAVFWWAWVLVLLVGILAFKNLRRSPGLLGMHLGGLLILVGAMYGSDAGHALAARFQDRKTIPSGLMQIYVGHQTNTVLDSKGLEIGQLPFSVGLKSFWIERHETRGPWLLGIDAPPAAPGLERRRQGLPWTVGGEMEIPLIGARLKVLQYLPGARSVYAPGAVGELEVTEADGRKTRVPATVGQKVVTSQPAETLQIVQVFWHLVVENGMAVDLPGSRGNPALRLECEQSDGNRSKRFAYTGALSPHGHEKEGSSLQYVLPDPVSAEADPGGHLPAMEVLLERGGARLRTWLIARSSEYPVALCLERLGTGEANAPGESDTWLMMGQEPGQVRAYKSDLLVLEENRPVTGKVIAVNDPLHYGGYHFYQSGYDQEAGQYTILAVKSDAGLWSVYAGFLLLCGGGAWLFWIQPVRNWLAKRRTHGD